MLQNLHVRNLALIDEIDVDFTKGLNILTGETGSGKSIIVDSIGLALGGRISRDHVKSSGQALTELVFNVTREETIRLLKEMDVEVEDGVVVISRKIQDGRSTIRVNGETRTASDVRECAARLLDIHGQSEHQKLLREDTQLELLDDYGMQDIASKKAKVREAYRVWHQLKKELGAEEMSEDERARRSAFLEFEIGEIEDAALSPGEDEEVEKTYRRLMNGRRIAEAVDAVHEATGYDASDAAGEKIGTALKRIEAVTQYDENLENYASQLRDIDSLLNDFNRDLADYADSLDDESASFEEVEERLNTINHLKTKYGRTIPDILDRLAEEQEELKKLEDYEESRERLKKDLAKAEGVLSEATEALRAERKRYAKKFTEEASRQFADLNFARADFAIEFHELGEYTANGKDAVDFCIATNPGAPLAPLKNVVSGGELSRLMLGIRTMFADTYSPDTIIFDEVDTGISGRTAQKVAEKLAAVAKRHQVLCITHLPQIAAMADTHYCITKSLSDTSAITNIGALDGEETVKELARLIGGAEITANTMNSAREMKDMCTAFKERL